MKRRWLKVLKLLTVDHHETGSKMEGLIASCRVQSKSWLWMCELFRRGIVRLVLCQYWSKGERQWSWLWRREPGRVYFLRMVTEQQWPRWAKLLPRRTVPWTRTRAGPPINLITKLICKGQNKYRPSILSNTGTLNVQLKTSELTGSRVNLPRSWMY